MWDYNKMRVGQDKYMRTAYFKSKKNRLIIMFKKYFKKWSDETYILKSTDLKS